MVKPSSYLHLNIASICNFAIECMHYNLSYFLPFLFSRQSSSCSWAKGLLSCRWEEPTITSGCCREELSWWGEVKTHYLKGLCFVIQGTYNFVVRLGKQSSKCRLSEGLCVWALPCLRNWRNCTLHLVFNGLVFARALIILREHNFETSVSNSDIGKTKVQVQVLVILDQINDSQKDGIEGIINNFFSKKASSCNGDWVAVDHAEALLENWILTLRWNNLFFAWIVNKVALQARINNEARSHVVYVLAV